MRRACVNYNRLYYIKRDSRLEIHITAVQEPVFWAGGRDQWLLMTLDQKLALVLAYNKILNWLSARSI